VIPLDKKEIKMALKAVEYFRSLVYDGSTLSSKERDEQETCLCVQDKLEAQLFLLNRKKK
jgi:hypothetical protein